MGRPRVTGRLMSHKEFMIENPRGKRTLGLQRQRWTDTMNRDLTRINVTFNFSMTTYRQ